MAATSGRPSVPWFARSAIPPLILLSVLSSFAYNHSLITSERREEVRRHRIQVQVLQDLLDYRTTQLYALRPPGSVSSWLGLSSAKVVQHDADQEAMVRRLFSVGLDPRAYGFTLPASLSAATDPQGPRTTNWSDIVLGSKESRTSLADKWKRVVAGIGNSFSSLSSISPASAPSSHEQEELARIEREWTAALATELDTDSTQEQH